MSDVYRLHIQLPVERPRADLETRWTRVPTVVRRDDGIYTFGEADQDGVMELEFLGDDDPFTGVEVRIPRPWVHARGPQVFALVFMTAEWVGATVYDPQIDADLQKDAVLQGLVAMRQAQLGQNQDGSGGNT